MLKKIRTPLIIFLLLTAALLLAACGAEDAATPALEPTKAEAASPTDPPPEPTDPPSPTATTEPTEMPTPTSEPEPSPAPEERPDITIALPEGDPVRGRKLALKWRCFTCHVTGDVGPRLWNDQGGPAFLDLADEHLSNPAYTGFASTPEEYLIEAIIDPSVYIVAGDWEYKMDEVYDEELDDQDLADVIAWILTIDEQPDN